MVEPILNFVVMPIAGRGRIIKTIKDFRNEQELRRQWENWKTKQGFEGVLFLGDQQIDCFPNIRQ